MAEGRSTELISQWRSHLACKKRSNSIVIIIVLRVINIVVCWLFESIALTNASRKMFVQGNTRPPDITTVEILDVNEVVANEVNEDILSDL